MIFLGDLHGRQIPSIKQEFIQVGDLCLKGKKVIPDNMKFIYGNHDDIEWCRNKKNFLGDFGLYKDIFYISGANGLEIDQNKTSDIIDLYNKLSPRIVVSHDCPAFLYQDLFCFSKKDNSYTSKLLEELFAINCPKWWIFGHHHRSAQVIINDCHFVCLNILEKCEII